MEKNSCITRLIDESNKTARHAYEAYMNLIEKSVTGDKSVEFGNNSQEHTHFLILKLLENAQKHVCLYTDLTHKNFSDTRILKALREVGNQGLELHMFFRGNLPTDVLISVEERGLWDDIKYLSKTFKRVQGERAKEGVGELLLVDDHVRCEVIERDATRRGQILALNETHPERLGHVSIHYADSAAVAEKIKSYASNQTCVVPAQGRDIQPSQGRGKE